MKKVPSALKWLAETRARTAGRIAGCKQALELSNERVRELEAELEKQREFRDQLVGRIEQLEKDLASLDGSVTVFDERIDPQAIGVVNGWAGKYGKRGAFRECLLDVLKQRAPDYVSTSLLAAHVIAEFGLWFVSAEERKAWYDNNLRGALKKMDKLGKVERSPGSLTSTEERGWRIRQDTVPTLAQLRERRPGE